MPERNARNERLVKIWRKIGEDGQIGPIMSARTDHYGHLTARWACETEARRPAIPQSRFIISCYKPDDWTNKNLVAAIRKSFISRQRQTKDAGHLHVEALPRNTLF
jgi:hypothetical protein